MRHRIVADYSKRIEACLDVLTEQEVWTRPNDASNSVGNLVLHLCGSTRHFLGKGVGGSDYRRDRPAEFAERGPIPISSLRETLAATIAEADRLLGGLAPQRLDETTMTLGEPFRVSTLLLRVSHHWAEHMGQIVYFTKARHAGVFKDLFKKTMR